jgi:peptide-methionine (S)-S-oxide reductase
MKATIGILLALSAFGGYSAWRSSSAPASKHAGAGPTRAVGTHPGGVGEGKILGSFEPAPGDSLVAFSAGCFWGSEEAFRKMPGIVATAVGYTGGTSAFPSYRVAHLTGHAETVLVEFNPKVTPFSSLLKTFWSLRLATEPEGAYDPRSPYRSAIWTYDSDELTQASAGQRALEKKEHRKFRTRVQPAMPFYLAEDDQQQYDEKSGTLSCPAAR